MFDPQRKFAARRDLAGAALILGIVAFGGFLVARNDLIPWPMIDKIGWLFIMLGVLALWDWWVTSYEIVQEQLTIRSGLGSQTVQLCNIESVQQVGGKLRLKCHKIGSPWITVTPVDRQAFVLKLRQHCPWLRLEGNSPR